MFTWFPQNISTYGDKVDWIIYFIVIVFGVWLVIAEGTLLGFILRYRKRPEAMATYEPGTTRRALAWILVPITILLALDIGIDLVQAPIWNEIKLYLPKAPDHVVRIVARQFSWEFVYAGADVRWDTADDVHSINTFAVPVHAKIVFELQSADVLHSLWIPNLRLKQDAVPGRTIKGWFEATETGSFPIACAELCGVAHGIMKGTLQVMAPDVFAQWLQSQSTVSMRGRP